MFSSDEQQSFSTQTISDSLNSGARDVGSGINKANLAADSWGDAADGEASAAPSEGC